MPGASLDTMSCVDRGSEGVLLSERDTSIELAALAGSGLFSLSSSPAMNSLVFARPEAALEASCHSTCKG